MKYKRGGFTLVETIVVMAISVLLLGIGVWGLQSYTEYARFKEQNENARTLFLATQESLTHISSSGQLDDFCTKVTDTEQGGLPLYQSGVYRSISPSINDGDAQRLYTLFYNVDHTNNGPGSTDLCRDLIKQLLEPYIANTDLWNGSFAIELDPRDGLVYSVSYSSSANSLYYGGVNSSDRNMTVTNISQRDPSVRQSRMLGYYDCENLATAKNKAEQRTTINDVMLINDEELYLHFTLDDDYTNAAKLFHYTIYLYDGADSYQSSSRPLMYFEFDGADLKDADNVLNDTSNRNASGFDQSELVFNTSISFSDGRKETYPLRAYTQVENGKTYFHISFDSVDFAVLDALNKSNGTLSSGRFLSDIHDTGSIVRFNLDADSIYCRIKGSSAAMNVTTSWKQSNTEDILFANRDEIIRMQTGTGAHYQETTYGLLNNRHLYNIRFAERLAKGQEHSVYQIQNDIDFDTNLFFDSGDTLFNQLIGHYYDYFPSVETLSSNSVFTSKNSNFVINNLVLKNQTGMDGIGMFLVNKGTISSVQLKNASVRNYSNVGAKDSLYIGTLCAENDGILTNCTVDGTINGGTTSSNKYALGGLIGYNAQSAYIFSCSSTTLCNGPLNVGGLVGENEGTVEKSQFKGNTFFNVNSNTLSTNIGGVVGLNDAKGTVIECNGFFEMNAKTALNDNLLMDNVGGVVGLNKGTVKNCSTGKKGVGTYISGRNNVGGVIGLQSNKGSLISDSSTFNKTNVIGEHNVGGIIGALEGKDGVVTNYINEGMIVCRKENGGGIVGENNGIIRNCRSYQRKVSSSIPYDLLVEKSTGSQIGGLSGINNGTITADSFVYNSVVLCGNNNVGGIVGENNGTILNQSVSSAYINATGNNIGGFIGFNKSINGFNGDTGKVSVTVNEIKGLQNVGGVVGYTQLKESGAYTIDVSVNGIENGIRGEQYIGGAFGYMDVKNNALLTLKAVTPIDVPQIKGEIYVGGFLGLISDNSSDVLIKDVINNVNVVSTSITETDQNGKGFTYTGGITGYNNIHTTIDHCTNNGQITIHPNAKYLAGLVEVNDGTITNCVGHSLGDYSRDYVGGLVGVNGKTNASALIQNCHVSGNIIGNNYVGGLLVENNALVSTCSIDVLIQSNGSYIGGVASINHGSISDIQASVDINTSGDHVGGIVGENYGTLQTVSFTKSTTVKGNNYVGGIVGYQHKGALSLNDLTNINNVIGTSNVAGICGGMDSDIQLSIDSCNNYGDIISTMEDGYAAGCTPIIYNDVSVNQFHNKSTIASKSYAGGLAVINNGYISHSSVTETTISGNDIVGGFVAENIGTIDDSLIDNVSLTVLSTNANAYIGGIAGENIGIIYKVSTTNNGVTINNSIEGSYIGGVTGFNHEGGSVDDVSLHAELTANANMNLGGIAGVNAFDSSITNAHFSGTMNGGQGSDYGTGGIAGINDGMVSDCGVSELTIKVVGDAANPGKAGGIVGILKENGVVTYCTVETLSLTNLSNSAAGFGYMGGVVGYSYGDISYCGSYDYRNDIDLDSPVEIASYRGDNGGIVGYMTYTSEHDASINNSQTGYQWKVSTLRHETDTCVGGIIGYSGSGSYSYSNLINRAFVSKTGIGSTGDVNCVGGIVGRMENVRNTWLFDHCVNFGEIQGYSRMGGIIGNTKYHGGTVSNCVNYGKIYQLKSNASNDNYVGGMIGLAYEIENGDKLIIDSCTNFGEICTASTNTTQIAGIFGGNGSKVQTLSQLEITNCVNVGPIVVLNAKTSASGITVLKKTGGTVMSYVVNNNINYYTLGGNSASGIVYGMDTTFLSKTSLVNNIDAGNNNNPAINLDFAKIGKNYYFTKADNETRLRSLGLTVETNDDHYTATGHGIVIDDLKIDAVDPTVSDAMSSAEWADNELLQGITTWPSDPKAALSLYKYVYLNAKLQETIAYDDKDYSNLNIAIQSVTIKGETYTVEWNTSGANVDTSTKYQVLVYKAKDGLNEPLETDVNGLPIKDETTFVFDEIVTSKQMVDMIVNDKSMIGSRFGVMVKAISSVEGQDSEWSAATYFTIKKALPVPQFHLYNSETKTTTNNADLLPLLENIDEYPVGTIIRVLNVGNELNYKIQEDGTLYEINKRKPGGINTGSRPIVFQAIAPSESEFANSNSSSLETVYINVNTGNNLPNNNISLLGFYGSDSDSLSYRLRFNVSSGFSVQQYFRLELLVTDERLNNLPVSVSNSIYRVNNLAGGVEIALSNLPMDMMNKDNAEITILSNIWHSQTDFIHYYEIIKEKLTAQDMLDYLNGRGLVDDQGSLKKGYIIEKGDSGYTLYYSASYASSLSQGCDANGKGLSYYVAQQVSLPEKASAVEINSFEKESDSSYSLKFSDIVAIKGSYRVSLQGFMSYDDDGNPLNPTPLKDFAINSTDLSSVTVEGNSVIYNSGVQDQWRYRYIRVVVEHEGSVNSSNKTESLSNITHEDYCLSVPLSTLSVPKIRLESLDAYRYQLSWSAYTDSNNPEIPNEMNYVQNYAIEAIAMDSNGNVLSSQNTLVDTDVCDKTLGTCSYSYLIDLDDSVTNDALDGAEVVFKIKALAKTDGDLYYSDSAESVGRITMLHRLQTPFSDNHYQIIVNDAEVYPTFSGFEDMDADIYLNDGLNMNILSNSVDAGEHDIASYQFVYRFNDEPYSDEVVSCGGNIQSANFNLVDLPFDEEDLLVHAGEVIHMKFRLFSNDSVSSKWSDEISFSLPNAKLVLNKNDLQKSSYNETIIDNNDMTVFDPLSRIALTLAHKEHSGGALFVVNYIEKVNDPMFEFAYTAKLDDGQEVRFIPHNQKIRIDDDLKITYQTLSVDEEGYALNDASMRISDINDAYWLNKEIQLSDDGSSSLSVELSEIGKTYTDMTNSSFRLSLKIIINLIRDADDPGQYTIDNYQLVLLDTVNAVNPYYGLSYANAITSDVSVYALGDDARYLISNEVRYVRTAVNGSYTDSWTKEGYTHD